MKKRGVKKYQIGAEGLLGGSFKSAFSGGGSGMVNPGNANLMKMAPAQTAGMPISTPSTANPNAKSLTDIKLPAASSIPSAAKGPSFGDKAGAFMGNYGGAITSAASSLMPLLMKKPDPNAKPYKKGSKLIKYQAGVDQVASPSRKEAADLMRSYNAISKGFDKRSQELQDLGISEPARKSTPPSLIPSKQVSLKLPQQTLPTPKLNKVAIDKPSRRERKAEDKRLETLARAPITYSENTFAGPSDEELKTGKIRFDAEQARKTYEDKQFKDSFQSDVLGKTTPTLKNRSTEKNPILYKESVKEKNPYISFKQMSAADQKAYRAGMASGKAFEVGGRKYAAAKPEEMAFSARMASKKNKSNLSKQSSVDAILDKYDRTKVGSVAYEKIKNAGIKAQNLNPIKGPGSKQTYNFNSSGMANKNVSGNGINYFTNGRAFDQKTGKKGNYDARKGKIMWDASKSNVKQNPTITKPTQTPAQIDSVLSRIQLPNVNLKNKKSNK